MLYVSEMQENDIVLEYFAEADPDWDGTQTEIRINNVTYAAVRGYARIPYSGEEELVQLLVQLRDQGIPFLKDGRWGAANVFQLLRERGLVKGPVRTICSSGNPYKPKFGTL
jgi:hypothetical protein